MEAEAVLFLVALPLSQKSAASSASLIIMYHNNSCILRLVEKKLKSKFIENPVINLKKFYCFRRKHSSSFDRKLGKFNVMR